MAKSSPGGADTGEGGRKIIGGQCWVERHKSYKLNLMVVRPLNPTFSPVGEKVSAGRMRGNGAGPPGPHGTIFVATSLHAPTPPGPTARTRTHILAPLVSPRMTAFDFVTLGCAVQLVPVMGSGLICTS